MTYTESQVRDAYNALEEYDIATMKRGEEPHYPVWAKAIVDHARREGFIGVQEGEKK
jgi:hypothetical protein